MQRRKRLVDWVPRDLKQAIENEEWVVFLKRSMEEMMEGETGSVIQENCTSVFVGPLRNPAASCRVIEYIACLMSIPFAVASSNIIDEDELERIQRIYLDVKLVPNLVYAVKLLMSEKCCNTETDASSIATTGKWRSALALSVDELQTLERIMLLLCRLVHAKPEFLIQFCDAVFIVPDGPRLFQQVFGLEKRKSRIVLDLLAIMSQVLRSQSGNVELVKAILLRDMSLGE